MSEIGTRSDASKVILGCPRKGPEIVGDYPFDSAAIGAGIAGCLNTDGEFVAGAAAPVIGISRGASLAHTDRNAVTQAGAEVPLKLTDDNVFSELTKAELTFTAVNLRGEAGDEISITFVDDGAGAVEVSVDELAITVEMDDTAETGSSATAIKTAIDAYFTANPDSPARVSVAISEGDGAVVQDDFVEDFLEGGVDAYAYVVPGAEVFVDDTTGLAIAEDSGTTEMNWKYASLPLEGVSPTVGGESADCALVNM